jgi:hypothetical protein
MTVFSWQQGRGTCFLYNDDSTDLVFGAQLNNKAEQ